MTKLVVAMAVLVAACGTDSVSADDYPQELRDAFCRNFVKCGMAKDFDTCRSLNIGIDPYITASGKAAFDMNKAEFDGGKAQDCFDAIASASCDSNGELQRALRFGGPLPEACGQLVAGTLHEGETCGLGAECRSLQCDKPPLCNMACCTGTCVGDVPPVLAKVGESCADANCVNSAFCDFATDTCTALKPLNAVCTSQFECQFELTCVGSGPTGTCVSLPKLDEPCQGLCQDVGAACSPTSQTCVKVGLGGFACTISPDNCSFLYVCDLSSHCSAGLPLGAACRGGDLCANPGAFCDGTGGPTMGTCVLPKPDGMSCANGSQCVSHTCGAGQCIAEPVCI